MAEERDEIELLERGTVAAVAESLREELPGQDAVIRPWTLDASVTLRHEPGGGPDMAAADRIATRLRGGGMLRADRADWHVRSLNAGPEATTVLLSRTFLPDEGSLARQAGRA